MDNKVNLFFEDVSLPFENIDENFILKNTLNIFKIINRNHNELNIILCNNDFIKNINSDYRNKDYATDVISFSYLEDENFIQENKKYTQIGDIFLSIEQASIQFKKFTNNLEEEVKRLLAHSILHLFGYDHEIDKKQAAIMFAKEDEIIDKLSNMQQSG